MTHRQVRIFSTFLIALAMLFALIKLGIQEDWYSIVIALSSGLGVILQWAITSDDRPSIKQGDDTEDK